MYSDEDLNDAVKKGIFSASAVHEFRQHIAQLNHTHHVDEENFRLLSGFNDIFVVIASALLLASVSWLGFEFTPVMGAIVLAAGSWLLAEFFVKRRRMALPAIGLLLSYLGGLIAIPLVISDPINEWQFLAAAILSTAGAWLHWQRYRVPITLAAGVLALIATLFGLIVSKYPSMHLYYQPYLAIAGACTFMLAMYWDAKDPKRETRNSDIAFWLHLVAAPMIVHPIFSGLGILSGFMDYSTALVVISLYAVLALVSIAVDRRAVMVSALVYVIYALSGLLETYGLVSYSMAITGTIMGGSLLMLSAYWQQSRQFVLRLVPNKAQDYLPSVN